MHFLLAWEPDPWMIISEILPVNIKSLARSVANLANRMIAWLVTMKVDLMLNWSKGGKNTRGNHVIFLLKNQHEEANHQVCWKGLNGVPGIVESSYEQSIITEPPPFFASKANPIKQLYMRMLVLYMDAVGVYVGKALISGWRSPSLAS